MLNKKTIQALYALAVTGCALLSSCDDTTTAIGSSLVTDESQVVIATDFKVTGQTVVNPSVQSRTTVQVLGRFDAEGYGNFSSEFVTQFMPAATLPVSVISKENIDSLKLIMRVAKGAWVGDSVMPMGLEVYRLNRMLPAPIYSDFDPQGYYDPADKLAEKIYVCNALGANDSIRNLSYRTIDVTLPRELGQELFQLYLDHPEAYTFPGSFAKYFPGIYVRNNFGSGRVVAISSTTMDLYYHTTSTDSEGEEVVTTASGSYYAVTPEVVLNNNITYNIDQELLGRIDAGEQIIVAPVGRDVEMEFPLREVIDYYNANSGSMAVINGLELEIPAEAIENDYGIEPPTNLLLVLKKKKDEFFRKNALADDVTSFYATYDSANHRYVFSGLRGYLLDALSREESLTADDYTFVLTPINVITETNTTNQYYGTSTSYVAAINPYVGAPVMVKLSLDKSEITFTFSKQTVK